MNRLPEKLTLQERETFSNATYILPMWDAVNKINTEKLKSLNQPIAKICAVHSNNHEAPKAESDIAKGLEAELLLAIGACMMLTTNIWTFAGLVNGAIGRIMDIIYEEGHGPTLLPNAVLVTFDDYHGPTITTPEGVQVVLITAIKRTWNGKFSICSHFQIPLILAWAITVHKF
ncbi:8927_t:CDS:1 [Cetraspora pellucida]|uniref:8927_t:CDS:1 n=1 Tax=Cetraspora pellucida TaxID=1433469 RepID=A0A9N9IPD4_9GLOM|nr:8927_t:CDS:1 [Cetraspora pellucida]